MKQEHHHDQEMRELFKALTQLARAITAWIKQFGHQKPKGHLVFRPGQITPKTIQQK